MINKMVDKKKRYPNASAILFAHKFELTKR